jgi:exopolysaccharide biosynthesis polyprenyl glycosylphosphotransferase
VQQGLSGGIEPADLAYQTGEDQSDLVLPDMRTALDRLDGAPAGSTRTDQADPGRTRSGQGRQRSEHVTVGQTRAERVTVERVTVEHITTEYVTAEYVVVDPRTPSGPRTPPGSRTGEIPRPGWVAANHPPANSGPSHPAATGSGTDDRQGYGDQQFHDQQFHDRQFHDPSARDQPWPVRQDSGWLDGESWDADTSGSERSYPERRLGARSPEGVRPWTERASGDRTWPAAGPDAPSADTSRIDDDRQAPRGRKGSRRAGAKPAKSTNKGPVIPSPSTSAPGSPAPAGASDHGPRSPRSETGTQGQGSETGTQSQGRVPESRTPAGGDAASALSGGPLTGNAPPDYVTPDNAPPLAGAGGRIPTDRARNRAVDRHWSPARNSSGAARPATRPFIRIPGRHAAMSRRQTWETRYVRALLACDLLAGIAAGAATFGVRFGDEVTTYNRGYVVLSLILPVLWLLVLAFSRAYERRFLFVGTDEYQRVFRGGVFLIAGAAVMSYALELDLARSYVLAALPMSVVGSVVMRFALRKRLHRSRAQGKSMRRVIVVGHELAVIGITRQLKREAYHGLEVVGACLPPLHDGNVGLPVYGTFDDVADAVEAAAADTVLVLSCPELDGVVLRRLAWRLERDEVDLIVASALIDVAGARTTIRPVDGLPMLHVEHPRLHGGARLVKDLVDRIGALVLTLVLAPVLIGVALSVRLTSRGPVLFRQVRVGRDGSEFRIFKFRSMYVDAEARLAELRHLNEHDGVLFKIRDDPRVTPVGRWLRRLSLDELPQLLNVVTGQMSLVGPRPPLPVEVAAYADDVRRRLAVKPGMTGLWQVSGRSDLSWEEAVRLDLRYVENWSLSLDLVILLRTMTAVVRSSGAY